MLLMNRGWNTIYCMVLILVILVPPDLMAPGSVVESREALQVLGIHLQAGEGGWGTGQTWAPALISTAADSVLPDLPH